jgi:hypothetical protein
MSDKRNPLACELAPTDELVAARYEYRARICKRSWSPGIDSEELFPPTYVAVRVGTTYRIVVLARQAGKQFLGLKGLQIWAQLLVGRKY